MVSFIPGFPLPNLRCKETHHQSQCTSKFRSILQVPIDKKICCKQSINKRASTHGVVVFDGIFLLRLNSSCSCITDLNSDCSSPAATRVRTHWEVFTVIPAAWDFFRRYITGRKMLQNNFKYFKEKVFPPSRKKGTQPNTTTTLHKGNTSHLHLLQLMGSLFYHIETR